MKNSAVATYLTGSILVIGAVLFLLINISSGALFKSLRLDLTNSKIYTLTPGSKEIVRELKEPIVIRFYFSKKLAKVNPYLVSFASRVQDLLIQYERASKGKIVLEVIDPEPFSAEEDNAVNYGLQGVPVDNTGTELYLGLVATNSVTLQKVIPFLQPAREANLEYDISQLIYNLDQPKLKALGVISSLPLAGGKEAQPWVIWQQMAQLFELHNLDLNVKEIPTDITTLMVVSPDTFPSSVLKAIDSFVMRGGHVLAFVDPYPEVIDQETAYLNSLRKENAGDFRVLLQTWGIDLPANKVVADRSMSKSVTIRNENRAVSVNYPFWMDFTAKNFDKQDVLTSTLERVTIATPGIINPIEGATTKISSLIRTSDDAILVDAQKIPQYQQNLDGFSRDYQPSGSFTVAARVSGPVKSAYSDQTVADSNIIVIADADMLHDHFWINIQNVMGQQFAVPSSGNGNFVLSALDNLYGSNALISIRNRGTFLRPFETIQALQLKSQDKYKESEQILQQRLEATKQKLAQLEAQKKEGNSMLLSVQQKKEDEAFRRELVQTRRELRDLRHKLNQDIELVEIGVKFFSIGFIPLIIILGGLVVWGLQIQNELRSRRAACSTPKH